MTGESRLVPDPHDRTAFLGLSGEAVVFEVAAVDALAETNKIPENRLAQLTDTLAEQGVQVDARALPEHFDPAELTEQDWENIRGSSTPTLELWAAGNYHRQLARNAYNPLHSHRLQDEESRGRRGFVNEAHIRSLPLIHGMSAASFDSLAAAGAMVSNRHLFEASGQDALTYHSQQTGWTLLGDRGLGLDGYVFADFARPHRYHPQSEVTLVIDPEVMNQPGVFMTEKDIADCTEGVREYLKDVSTPHYFYSTALDRIAHTLTRETKAGRSIDQYHNTVSQFANGQDEMQYSMGGAPFSTWEVKLPSGAVPTSAIRKIVVRDQETYDQMVAKYGDRFTIEHAQLQLDRVDLEETAGNYAEVLQIPGKLEAEYQKMVEADFQARSERLAGVPEDERETVVIVYPQLRVETDDPLRAVTLQSNPYLTAGSPQIYQSAEAVLDDIEQTGARGYVDPLIGRSVKGHQVWFIDPTTFKISLRSGEQTCVAVTVERAKDDPQAAVIKSRLQFDLANRTFSELPEGI